MQKLIKVSNKIKWYYIKLTSPLTSFKKWFLADITQTFAELNNSSYSLLDKRLDRLESQTSIDDVESRVDSLEYYDLDDIQERAENAERKAEDNENKLGELGDNIVDIEGDIKTKMKIKNIGAGKHRWDTNSFTFNARFSSTVNSKFAFIYESKIGSLSNHASETRSRTTNETTKNEINHEARNGSVPTPRLNKLIKKYTKVGLMDNIPLNKPGKDWNGDRTYWIDKFVDLKPHSKMGDTRFHFGKSGPEDITIDNRKVSRKEFMEVAIDLYEGKPKKGNYDMELISKLRSLRYFEMLNGAAASTKHNKSLPLLVAKLYFMSSKINFKQGELAAPFIKIQ